MTDNSDKEILLEKVPYIYYLVQFLESQGQKNQEQECQEQARVLLNSGSEVNAMSPAYVKKLGFNIRKTNVGAQKIDGSALKTFEMVIAKFQMEDKGGRPRFFQKTFLVADTKFEVILGIFFLKTSNRDVAFGERTLT